MPATCKAKGCNMTRGHGISAFQIPDPKKNRDLCKKWLRNLSKNNNKKAKSLNINTFKASAIKIVCEKHFEPDCFEGELKAKYLPGYKPKYKHLKPDAVPTIFADSKPTTNRRIHTEKRIAKKERKELVAKLIAEYDKEKAEKEREKQAKNSENGSGQTEAAETEVNTATNLNDILMQYTDNASHASSNDMDTQAGVYIDKAEPFCIDTNATETNSSDRLSIGSGFNILPNIANSDPDNVATSEYKGFETVAQYMDFEQAASSTSTADFNAYLTSYVGKGPCAYIENTPFNDGTSISSDQLQFQTDRFVFNSQFDSVCNNSIRERSSNRETSVLPGRIDRTSPDALSLVPPLAETSFTVNSKQSNSHRSKKGRKKRKLQEDPEPKCKEIGIQVSIETCDKSVECNIPLDHTNSASCANCFARENPVLAMSDHKYSFRTDSEGKRVSKNNYKPKPKKKGSALAAIIQRLSNTDKRDSEAPLSDLDGTVNEIETETGEVATDNVCEAPSTTTLVEGDMENLRKMVDKGPSSADNGSPINVKEPPLEDWESLRSPVYPVEKPSSVHTESSLDVEESPVDDKVQSMENVNHVASESAHVKNHMEIGDKYEQDQDIVSGNTINDAGIPIGDPKTPRNVPQTFLETQDDHSKISVFNTADSVERTEDSVHVDRGEPLEHQSNKPLSTSEIVVCDAEIPVDDCVIEINETMDDSEPSYDEKRMNTNELIPILETAPSHCSINESTALSHFPEKVSKGKSFKKTIIPRMLHRYGKKSGSDGVTGTVNHTLKPYDSGILNTQRGHSTPGLRPPVSHIRQSETEQFQNPWQPWTQQNDGAKPSSVKKAKPHFLEILKTFKT